MVFDLLNGKREKNFNLHLRWKKRADMKCESQKDTAKITSLKSDMSLHVYTDLKWHNE